MMHELINRYRKKALCLEFKEIKLTQLGDGSNRIFVGPGLIEQNGDGALTYKIFYNSGFSLDKFFDHFNNLTIGKLIPENQYYSFEGIDIYGRKWISEKIAIDFHTSEDFTVIHENIHNISTTTTLPLIEGSERSGQFHQVWIPKKIRLPSNLSTSIKHFVGDDEMKSSISRSAAEYKNSFLRILLFHDEDWLVIQIKVGEDNFYPFVLERVLSAIQYILAEPMNWVIYEKRKKCLCTLSLVPFKEKHKKSRFHEPILGVHSNENDIWKLFDKYLNHIIQYDNDPKDPISGIISKCLHASQGSFDAFSLTLSLAVEEILNIAFKDIEVPMKIKEEDIRKFKEEVKQLDIEQYFKDRIESFIGYVQNITATDRLRELVEHTPITRKEYDNWKDIRNYFAHPDDSKLDTQEKVDKTYSVMTLLHKLIFLKIGYQGIYNDYGEIRWPKKEWTLNNIN
jgi:hypothetical protein